MSSYGIGFVVSAVVTVCLLVLFRYEETRGSRVCSSVRIFLDVCVTRVAAIIDRVLILLGKDSLRQIIHYILHAFLSAILAINKKWEQSLRNMMRANKSLARTAEQERTVKTKLEEIALHKIQNAMTEDEKKRHKEKMLQG